ncbi:MAG TPA: RNA polymerase sigma factor SigZ [Bacteroidetes bacterium]|nr:RNA polymerase sigma factor SigZ [Bacteroidota bacterium]
MENILMSTWAGINEHLTAFVAKKIRDEHTAKDIVHDVFLKVYAKIGTLNDERKINSWIFQITRNAITDHFREQKKSFAGLPADEPEIPIYSKDETYELSRCMLPMIGLLPEKYRDAVKLSDIEGLSQKELAEQLGISYSGAKSRVQRGREKLKELYLKCCEIDTDIYGNIIEYRERVCGEDCD